MQWVLINALALLALQCINVFGIGEKSREKCKEYAKLVYAEEDAPVLRMNVRSNTVSHCGIVEVPLIIGGSKAVRKEFPHMVRAGTYWIRQVRKRHLLALWRDPDFERLYFDGSPLLRISGHNTQGSDYRQWLRLLTYGFSGPAIKIRVGLTNQNDPGDAMQERNVAKRIQHPKYQPPVRYHDIGLIKLEEAFDLNAEVRPACLHDEQNLPGTKGIATGFGKLSFDGRRGSDDLMKVQLTYIPNDDCKETFKADLGGKQLPDGLIPNFICAGEMGGGKDTCQGDSGGPLQRVMKDPYCMYSVVGVTSFGKFCGFKNSPAIYSRVSSYLDWIESIVWP